MQARFSRRTLGLAAASGALTLNCAAASPLARPSRRSLVSRDVAATKHVVVVGAGLGGLSAALALRAMGFRVTVLERGASSGGRIRSVATDGFSIEANGRQWPKLQDLGAQFLNDRYTTLLPLLSSADPTLVPLRLSPRSITLRDRRAITVDREHPASIYDRGLLDLLDSARVKYAYDDVIDAVGGMALDDYSQWARFDNGLASSWLESHYGAMGTHYLGEPAIESYFFHRADETSQAFFFWLVANSGAVREWFTLAGHTQAIPAALHAKLVRDGGVVRLNTEVAEVSHFEGAVRVVLAGGERLDADGVIVATPSPVTRAIVTSPSPAQRPVIENPYAATIVVNFHCEREHAPLHRLGQVGGINVPRLERRGGIAGFSVESGKYPSGARGETLRGHEIYGVHLTSDAATRLLQRGDEETFDAVRRELEGYFPGILVSEKSRTLMRWPNAIPLSKPGRAQELAALWRAQEADAHRILLAGDQTTFATMDSAAHSGMRAAELLAAKVAPVRA